MSLLSYCYSYVVYGSNMALLHGFLPEKSSVLGRYRVPVMTDIMLQVLLSCWLLWNMFLFFHVEDFSSAVNCSFLTSVYWWEYVISVWSIPFLHLVTGVLFYRWRLLILVVFRDWISLAWCLLIQVHTTQVSGLWRNVWTARGCK